ncbi:MAG TPA: GIY-YIG nuclease family protein [Euryarchaeota archaeon]|nr:hypothetical protein BMS3Bbin15_01492 [archaeon BMS3Bbin15]HDL15716.1 GIY-YIG nuclease family protein [Euryarchaeota archaeon]
MKGSYLLMLILEDYMNMRIGKLGNFSFNKGYYCYTGSALSGLKPRLERHLQKYKKKRWHIDYFRENATLYGSFTFISEERLEYKINDTVAVLADCQPVRGFGSSDCSCFSHLNYFSHNPLKKLTHSLRRFSRESNFTLRFERFIE